MGGSNVGRVCRVSCRQQIVRWHYVPLVVPPCEPVCPLPSSPGVLSLAIKAKEVWVTCRQGSDRWATQRVIEAARPGMLVWDASYAHPKTAGPQRSRAPGSKA